MHIGLQCVPKQEGGVSFVFTSLSFIIVFRQFPQISHIILTNDPQYFTKDPEVADRLSNQLDQFIIYLPLSRVQCATTFKHPVTLFISVNVCLTNDK